MTECRIVLADDHTLVRSGLRTLIGMIEGVSIVGEASDGRQLLVLLDATHPDLVLLDVAMPGLSGLEALPRIRSEHPGIRVLILTAHANEEYVLRALRSGAAGYLMKDSSPAELEQAIRTVHGGGTFFSARVSPAVIARYSESIGGSDSLLTTLTSRQREVLQLIAESRTTKEIALLLRVSAKTVETHRAQLMERLGIHDLAGLVRFAIRSGLSTPEP